MDIADQAHELEEAHRATALAAHLRQDEGQRTSAERCESCANPIPSARRQALPGVLLCIHCAERLERRP